MLLFNNIKNNKGMTLVETLVAVFIFAIVVVGIYRVSIYASDKINETGRLIECNSLDKQGMESTFSIASNSNLDWQTEGLGSYGSGYYKIVFDQANSVYKLDLINTIDTDPTTWQAVNALGEVKSTPIAPNDNKAFYRRITLLNVNRLINGQSRLVGQKISVETVWSQRPAEIIRLTSSVYNPEVLY